jgi:hypothetical protein
LFDGLRYLCYRPSKPLKYCIISSIWKTEFFISATYLSRYDFICLLIFDVLPVANSVRVRGNDHLGPEIDQIRSVWQYRLCVMTFRSPDYKSVMKCWLHGRQRGVRGKLNNTREWLELYLHFRMCLYVTVFNLLSTGTLPFYKILIIKFKINILICKSSFKRLPPSPRNRIQASLISVWQLLS